MKSPFNFGHKRPKKKKRKKDKVKKWLCADATCRTKAGRQVKLPKARSVNGRMLAACPKCNKQYEIPSTTKPFVAPTTLASVAKVDTSLDANLRISASLFAHITGWFLEHPHQEIAGHGYAEDNELKWICFASTGTGGGVHQNHEDNQWALLEAIEAGWPCVNVQWHTHPGFGAHFSGTDEGQQARTATLQQELLDEGKIFFVVVSGLEWLTRLLVWDKGGARFNEGHAVLTHEEKATQLSSQQWHSGQVDEYHLGFHDRNYRKLHEERGRARGTLDQLDDDPWGDSSIEGWQLAARLQSAYDEARWGELNTLVYCADAIELEEALASLALWGRVDVVDAIQNDDGRQERDEDDDSWWDACEMEGHYDADRFEELGKLITSMSGPGLDTATEHLRAMKRNDVAALVFEMLDATGANPTHAGEEIPL